MPDGATPDESKSGAYIPQELGYAFGALVVGFFFCTVTIFIYNYFAHDSLVWFSVTEIFWYLIGFSVYAFQKIVKERRTSEKQ